MVTADHIAEDSPANEAAITQGGTLSRALFLGLLLLITAFAYVDRVIVQTLGQEIKEDLLLSDFQLGLLGGLAFAILYSTLGLPIARLAERRNRVKIVSVSVGLFSLMTALSGFAGSFVSLFLCRIGVGIGEAGVQSPAASLISDRFPVWRRGFAISVMKLGSPLGSVLGAIGGGWIAHVYGWRAALMATAVPGILLALAFFLFIREPMRGLFDAPEERDQPTPSLRASMAMLSRHRAFWHLIAGLGLATMGLYAGGAFVTPFFIRVHHLSLIEAGTYFAILGGTSATIGLLGSGVLIDFAVRRSRGWFGYLPAIGLALAAPLYVAGYWVGLAPLALALQTLGGLALIVHNVPTLVALQSMVAPRMRATASFVFFFVSTLVGVGMGPSLIGILSDMFAQHIAAGLGIGCPPHNVDARCAAVSAGGLQHALIVAQLLYVWAAFHYFAAGRAFARESAELTRS